ncbi:MAG: carboxy-S-adenosyl-L-methionine synthase CmoA [Gammaproteobacteria bacterium]|nr:carboxy-S-adenosyl-L-methionine synthase CmoA [Gammaproteobacteria bacterium]MDG1952921.1 carboxy-S-adenosyl-L-methionine synthase CmoA [Gammaproteobacteria bacterium]MDG2118960.1 carboxy-S-adenosyl-L-methionine synthase CmoA [Gammaproteobacteria bacterium]|tara:strand:- start:6196 stop:6936 length:741 start_codon:yes stop_codon:yes gene_type:complete
MNNRQSKDTLFNTPNEHRSFTFDEQVATVFDDMINRSVPGYSAIIDMVGQLAHRYCKNGSIIYDLGCSLGASSLSITRHIEHNDYEIIAIDNSEAMVSRLKADLQNQKGATKQIKVKLEDIRESEIKSASMVILNFTLQFINVKDRDQLIKKISAGMRPGGLLIISEKVSFTNMEMNSLFIDLYHKFKEKQGYSELEISQKRDALENVLIPESLEKHYERLLAADFELIETWLKYFNFASIIAFKK